MLSFQHVSSVRKSLCLSSSMDKGTLVCVLALGMFCTRIKNSLPGKAKLYRFYSKPKYFQLNYSSQ